ncbi:MAG TPA: methionyl-tRNA formyltransferase [Syntrophobacteraceae bacterium]|nr:methionyl-tRNA formyltransferase [Syntrophobacteraceae bacterium]
MRIVFLGNHTVGVRALEALLQKDEVVGVVAHPPDPEDGIRYLSVYDFSRRRGLHAVRKNGRDPGLEEFVRDCRPDLLWITDYRYLLPQGVLTVAPLGVVNLHPSLLPAYRGRAPINWAILHGERELGLTVHFVDEGMDTGDIIEQVPFFLSENQDVGDALCILYPLYGEITRRVIAHFRKGKVPRRPQDHRRATVFPRRTPEDGLIQWEQRAERIRDLVRAVAPPYPGAFSFCHGRKIRILSAAVRSEEGVHGEPGSILSLDSTGPVVCAGTGTVWIRKFEWEPADPPGRLNPGDRMENR